MGMKLCCQRLQLMACRAGFSLMFYGFGSKRQYINEFVAEKLTDGGLVEINAWHSPVTAKEIVASVLSALSGESEDKLRCETAPFAYKCDVLNWIFFCERAVVYMIGCQLLSYTPG
jgi:hypothetical protein